MKKLFEKLSPLAVYYFKSIGSFFVFFAILNLISVEYINQLFFMVCFIWHFTLNTPGLKEKMLTNKKQRFSFLNVIVRVNYYLQLFIKTERIPFGPALVRAISPLLFIFFLKVVGGNGNILFALLGCFCFELTYFLFNRKTTSVPPSDPETPPEIPSAEIFHE